jgi:hypothetical protein
MIFSRKQDVVLEDFCHDFYEKNILNPVIEGVDAGAVFYDTARRAVVEADPDFVRIGVEKFAAEMTLLRFEMFALAWLHKFGDKLAVAQSAFTKIYLHEKKRNDIWNDSEPYNQAIARSSTAGYTPETASGRAYLGSRNQKLADLFGEYHKQGFEPESVARALNRLFTDVAWRRDVTANFLTFTLSDRLGFKPDEPNKEAQFRLTAMIHGFYDGARQSLDKVRIKV